MQRLAFDIDIYFSINSFNLLSQENQHLHIHLDIIFPMTVHALVLV